MMQLTQPRLIFEWQLRSGIWSGVAGVSSGVLSHYGLLDRSEEIVLAIENDGAWYQPGMRKRVRVRED